MKKQLTLFVLFLFIFIAASANAAPVSIFDNFGPAPGYRTTSPVGLSVGPISVGENTVATIFTPAETANLTSIDVPFWNTMGTENTIIEFSLVGDAAGEPGTTLIESFILNPGAPLSMDVYTLTSTNNPLLDSNESYWLVAESTENVGWQYTTSNATDGLAYALNHGDWFINIPSTEGRQTALRVYGEPVPLPGAIILLGSGLLGLIGFNRKSKRS